MKEEQSGPAVRFASVLSILAAGIMWGSMGLWVRKFNSTGLGSMEILALRMSVTVLLLSSFLLVYDRKLLRIRLRDLWCFLGTGICSIVFFGYCYNRTILETSMAVAAILLYTAPIFVMLLSRVLFGESFTVRKICALCMAFSGCVCVTGIVGKEMTVSTMGILTGLGSGFGYALYSIFGRYAIERKYHPFTITFYTFVCGLAAVIFLADWQGVAVFVKDTPGNLLFSLAYGMITTVLPYILYTFGLSHVEAGQASVMATVEPVVAAILGIAVFGESLTVPGMAGILLVLGALIILK